MQTARHFWCDVEDDLVGWLFDGWLRFGSIAANVEDSTYLREAVIDEIYDPLPMMTMHKRTFCHKTTTPVNCCSIFEISII